MEREIAIAPKQNKMTWLDWVQNILIISAVVIFTLNYTIVGVLRGGWFSPLKNLVMIGIFLLFVYRFFTVSKEERKQWFTQKFLRVPSFVWLLAYFIVRCICFAVNGFQYGIAREIFFEFVFLVAICPWTVGPRVRFDIIAWVFCGINLVMNLANTYCCHVLKVFYEETGGSPVKGGLLGFLTHLKTYAFYGEGSKVTPLYSNPNSAGIMTGMALLLSLLLISKKKLIPLFVVYWVYSLYVLYADASRGAIIGFVVAIICICLLKLIPNLQPRLIVIVSMLVCIGIAVGIYGFISYNLSDGDRHFTELETKLDDISSTRYQIWQTCYRAHKDTRLLGEGSAALEKQVRNERIRADLIEDYATDREFVPTTYSIHNGYLATIFITGWLGFLFSSIIFFDKIVKSNVIAYSTKKSVFLSAIVVFSFMVSNFEALMITSRYYTILILLLILAWQKNFMRNNDNGN